MRIMTELQSFYWESRYAQNIQEAVYEFSRHFPKAYKKNKKRFDELARYTGSGEIIDGNAGRDSVFISIRKFFGQYIVSLRIFNEKYLVDELATYTRFIYEIVERTKKGDMVNISDKCIQELSHGFYCNLETAIDMGERFLDDANEEEEFPHPRKLILRKYLIYTPKDKEEFYTPLKVRVCDTGETFTINKDFYYVEEL